MIDLAPILFAAIADATGGLAADADEDAFQAALAARLVPCERELRASFAPPSVAPRCPPESAIRELAARTPPRLIPAAGLDPCVSGARLDLLWASPVGPVPVELKFC